VAVALFQPFQERPEHRNGQTSNNDQSEPREQQPPEVGPIEPVALAAGILPVLADDFTGQGAR